MANYLSDMPIWAILLFIVSFLFSIAFITTPIKQAALNAGLTPQKSRNIQIAVFFFYLGYLLYVSLLSLNGMLTGNTIPPKVLVFAGLPLMLFLFGFIWNNKQFKLIFRSITLEALIFIHAFRIVGIFFILLYFYHLLPKEFAVSGELGDIITAVFAIPVARLATKQSRWRTAAVVAWNIFGILDIVRLLIIATVTAKYTAATGIDGGLREITVFPFVWFPAFAPPTILFMHALVFRKLMQQKMLQAD